MSTPKRGKTVAVEATKRSSKNFRWSQSYEDTLLDLLVREARKGNRPNSRFTAIAYRNVVTDFNRIHGTTIMRKHVQSRIKTMKQHFVLFHGAFTGLSGFSWNHETKMFQAEDYLWEQRILENPKLEKFREKACHNWDKLFELYGDTRATRSGASGLKEKSNTLQREFDFVELCLGTHDMNCGDTAASECSSYGENNFSKEDAASTSTPEYGSSQQSGGSSRSKLKRKASLISVMEDGYKTMAASIDKLSMALVGTLKKVAGNKFDVSQNEQIYDALVSLGLDEDYKVKCYCYLCVNPSKAALLVAAPNSIRGKLLQDIMTAAGDEL